MPCETLLASKWFISSPFNDSKRCHSCQIDRTPNRNMNPDAVLELDWSLHEGGRISSSGSSHCNHSVRGNMLWWLLILDHTRRRAQTAACLPIESMLRWHGPVAGMISSLSNDRPICGPVDSNKLQQLDIFSRGECTSSPYLRPHCGHSKRCIELKSLIECRWLS
jgi:hypothetical protein